MRAEGKVKWFSTKNKYGFITDKEGNDVYFQLENITSSRDELDKDKKKGTILPENGDMVEYTAYSIEGAKRAKKIAIVQRMKSTFICPSCSEKVKPKIVFDNNEKNQKVGKEFEKKQPMHTVCPNCYVVLGEYETSGDKLSIYNRSAMLALILLIIYIFVEMFVKK